LQLSSQEKKRESLYGLSCVVKIASIATRRAPRGSGEGRKKGKEKEQVTVQRVRHFEKKQRKASHNIVYRTTATTSLVFAERGKGTTKNPLHPVDSTPK